MIRIIVDDREKSSKVPLELANLGARVEYKHLEIGDYIPLPEVVVERKCMRDLIKSIYDGRLFIQCSNMLKHYDKALLIVEYEDIAIDNPLIVYGALSSIALDFDISIINSYSALDTAYTLLALAKRKRTSSKPMLKKIKKSNSLYEQQLLALAALPGIGEKSAIKLLDRFGSPLQVMNANVSELARVIGYAKASKIKKMLATSYRDNDEIFDTSWFKNL
jgi:DNA excision repair protein ERCC-4